MSEEVALMATATSPWPANIDTAQVLAINSPCSVPDAYQLICDRKNIKKLNVAGREYTSQEVRCMPFSERLGGMRSVVETAEDLDTTIAPDVQPPREVWQIDWGTTPTPGQRIIGPNYNRVVATSPTYEQAMETLRINHPHYETFGDVPPVAPATTPPSRIFTADVGTWAAIDPIHDYYTRPW